MSAVHLPFAANWHAEVLTAPPMIAPAQHYVYPQRVAGEEDALARGALLVRVKPAAGSEFLLTCALGFRDPAAVTAVYSTPARDTLLAVAGGYAYLADTRAPEVCTFVALRPVLRIVAALDAALLLLVGSHAVEAIAASGLAWRSPQLSHEGITLSHIAGNTLHGTGWNMHTDREVPFALDLHSGQVCV
jgi:hypothetical protein